MKFIPYALVLLSLCICDMRRTHGEELIFATLSKKLKSAPITSAILVILITLLSITGPKKVATALENPMSLQAVPKSAVDFILEKELPAPYLHEFTHGGYFMFRFSNELGEPSTRVPIDGRTNVNDPDIVRKFTYALRGDRRWEEYIEAVNPKTILWTRSLPLVSFLQKSEKWCEVYKTTDSPFETPGWSIFLRSDVYEQRNNITKKHSSCAQ